jgi:hypothetical protein
MMRPRELACKERRTSLCVEQAEAEITVYIALWRIGGFDSRQPGRAGRSSGILISRPSLIYVKVAARSCAPMPQLPEARAPIAECPQSFRTQKGRGIVVCTENFIRID